MFKNLSRRVSAFLLILTLLSVSLFGCQLPEREGSTTQAPISVSVLEILNGGRLEMERGDTLQLALNLPSDELDGVAWSVSTDAVTVSDTGLVTAQKIGTATVTAKIGSLSARTFITVTEKGTFTLAFSNGSVLYLLPDETVQLQLNLDAAELAEVEWTLDNDAITVSQTGLVKARMEGEITVTATFRGQSASLRVIVENGGTPPSPPPVLDYTDKEAFYANYVPAYSLEDAQKRTQYGLMSGTLTVPDQAPSIASERPKSGSSFIRNNEPRFVGDSTYIVVDQYGQEVFRVYRGGAYITLEEVAAYVYAFGDVPANYVSKKNTKPSSSIWGEYLRLNHTEFSGDVDRFPSEPILPDISGCGGDLQYYEIDIGTLGTDCDPSYDIRIYNDGYTITRGAARIVYARYDKNGDTIIDPNERYLFYTYNHYNDFQEYLNYYGGWGEMFGNITGGGVLSSKNPALCNPTPYVPVVMASLRARGTSIELYYLDPRFALSCALVRDTNEDFPIAA